MHQQQGVPMIPITHQPQPQGNWMSAPMGRPDCPPGLEYLTMIDQLLVHQKMSVAELFFNWETENKYEVKNSVGQQVYAAIENSGCIARQCCGPLRPYEMRIFDNYNHEVLHLHRPLNCQGCCCPCCLQVMEVTAPPGTVIGRIEQEWSIFPRFKVKNAAGSTIFLIHGPFFAFSCCGNDVKFDVLTANGKQKVGKISKQWTGIFREGFTDADFFGINFPMDLDVQMKATLLGALFLIDAMYFEKAEK